MTQANPQESAGSHIRQLTPDQKPVIWGGTNVGREREGNEDAIFPQSDGHGLKYRPNEETLTRKGYLLVVADGIGGAQAGSEASQWAIRRVVENYYELPGGDLGEDLRTAIAHANSSLNQYMASTNTPDAGCTMSASVIHNNHLYVANVGDSRVYLIRQGQIYQLTRDHTLTQQKIDQGLIDPAMADSDASRSVLTRSLGASQTVQVDLFSPTSLQPGDRVLLCSDGLYDMVENEQIAYLAQGGAPQKVVQRLIKTANRQGGLDNISVIIAQIPGRASPSTGGDNKFRVLISKLAVWQRVTVLLLALLTFIVCGLIGWTLSQSVLSRNKDQDPGQAVTATVTMVEKQTAEATSTATPQIQPTMKATSTAQPTQDIASTPEPTMTLQAAISSGGDRDNDQVLDIKDACPDVAGLAAFDGCPDSDGDGVPDPDDECPTEGLASKAEDQDKPFIRGCLDTDQDGFPNTSDACPSTWAAANTDGCPVAEEGESGDE